jgi:hypothetical protein
LAAARPTPQLGRQAEAEAAAAAAAQADWVSTEGHWTHSDSPRPPVKHPAADCPCKPGPLDDLDDYVEASDATLARAAAELLLLADEEERLRAPAQCGLGFRVRVRVRVRVPSKYVPKLL